MSGAFTPGPWSADFHNECRDGGRYITHVTGGNQLVPIAAVPTGVEGYGREEGRANARLIAAVPDLLEALRNLADRHFLNGGSLTEPAYLAARAAISKALGAQS